MEAERLVNGECGDPADVLGRMSDEEVERTLLALRRHLITTAWFHHAIAEFDRRHVADREYVLSTTQ